MLGQAFVTFGGAPALAIAPAAVEQGGSAPSLQAAVGMQASALERVTQGPPGPPGPPGASGPCGESVPNASAVAETAIAAGQPVFIDLSTRLMGLAQADVYARRGCVGLARADVAAGQVGDAEGKVLTLADWTAATGSAGLVAGRTYFLAGAPGLLTLIPPDPALRGRSVVRVGIATGPQTMALLHAPPVLL